MGRARTRNGEAEDPVKKSSEESAEAEDEDEEESDLDDDDEEGEEPGKVTVERMGGFDEWEMYRLWDEEEYEGVCTIALRPVTGRREAEYGVWRRGKDTEEPGTTGEIEWKSASGEWDDAGRADALRLIVYRYEEDLGVTQERLTFRLDGPPADGDDEDEEDDEDRDDEDEEGDDDGDEDADDEGEE